MDFIKPDAGTKKKQLILLTLDERKNTSTQKTKPYRIWCQTKFAFSWQSVQLKYLYVIIWPLIHLQLEIPGR